MIKQITMVAFMGALVVGLYALPVQAEMVAISDEDLTLISGKSNVTNVIGSSEWKSTIGNDSGGNLQVHYYAWEDNHNGDLSDQKGSNFFDASGGNNEVQQNVVAAFNAITWGASVDHAAIWGKAQASDTLSGNFTQTVESWATLYIGGF